MTSTFVRIASLVVPLLVLDVMALGAGCGDHPDGSPLLDCDADGGGGCNSANSGGSSSGAPGTAAGTGGDTTGTGTGEGDGGAGGTGATGITDGSGGAGNILPTDTGSTGSLPTNTE